MPRRAKIAPGRDAALAATRRCLDLGQQAGILWSLHALDSHRSQSVGDPREPIDGGGRPPDCYRQSMRQSYSGAVQPQRRRQW